MGGCYVLTGRGRGAAGRVSDVVDTVSGRQMRRDDGGAGSDVVTGQVDVREIAASLPDPDPVQV
jgi:hypothetical protein